MIYIEKRIYIPNNQKNLRTNPTKESWNSRYRTFRTTKNAQVNQEELLVAINIEWHQEVCSEMPEVLIE